MSDLQRDALSFLAAYLIHSTLLIGAVWAFLKVRSVKSSPVREALWTVALFGGIVTAGIQSVLPLPSSFRWNILPAEVASTKEVATADTARTVRDRPARVERGTSNEGFVGAKKESVRFFLIPAESREAVPFSPDENVVASVALPPKEVVPVRSDSSTSSRRSLVMIGMALALAALSILSLILRTIGGLRGRQPVPQGPLRALLTRLCEESGFDKRVRLTHTSRLVSPVAFGLLRPEICVPTRAIEDLGPEPQRAMLAHELAHLRRRDPLRLLLCRIVETIFFFQPLNRLARRRLFEVVECRCDAWAVERLGYGVSLAECLAEVAGWLTEGRARSPLSQIAMAGSGSPLAHRIRRLLREDEVRDEETRRKRVAPLSWLLLPIVLLAAPAVGSPEPDRADGRSGSTSRRLDARGDGDHGRDARSERRRSRAPSAGDPSAMDAAKERREDRPSVIEIIDLLDLQIESIAARVQKIREALGRVPNGNKWLSALEPIERRLHDLEGRRALLRAIGEKLTQGDGLSPTPAGPSGLMVESEEASDG